MVERAPDPFAVMESPEGDVEAETTEAISLTQAAFRAQEKKMAAEVKDYRPIEFFRVLVFATPAQACEFAKAIGQPEHQQYMDGRKVADFLGIEIPKDVWKPKKSFMKPNKRLAALAMPLPARGPKKPG